MPADPRIRPRPAHRRPRAACRFRPGRGSSQKNLSSPQPLARVFGKQRPRARARLEAGKMSEVLRIVDIEGDPGQVHDAWLDPASARRGEMREEAVFAKAQ